MEVIQEKATGNVYILKSCQYNNIDAVNVTVAENCIVRFYGSIVNLTIMSKAIVYLHGNLKGELINHGGSFQVFEDYKN